MGKEFIEYHSENGRIPYSASTLCFCLTQYAKDYISENRKITSNIDKKIRDAVLIDAINYLGVQCCFNFALHTKDLYDGQKHKEEVDPQCLLTTIINYYAYYMFNQGIVESVLRSNCINECTEQFDANDGAVVLLDFINYISKRNDFDRTFTIKELYEKFKVQKHNNEMDKLKKFLELTSKYSEELVNGHSIDAIFESMARNHNLKYVAEDGTYHYTDIISNRIGQSQMYSWDAKEVDEEIYAMAYAYGKMNNDSKQVPQTEIINKKILEMKKR